MTLPANYEAMPGAAKLDYLWRRGILPTVYGTKPALDFSSRQAILDALATPLDLFLLKGTFDHVSDEMPLGHRKFVHSFGAVAPVRWRSAGGHPYTGLFAEGDACGLIRLSLAAPPKLFGYAPGLALKLFVDGQPSQNIVALHTLGTQGKEPNLFAHELTNDLPEPTSLAMQVVKAILATAKPDPLHLPVDGFARVTASGKGVSEPRAPRSIAFVAPDEIKAAFAAKDAAPDFREVLGTFPEGTTLCRIVATDGGGRTKIGSLTLASRFVASRYGDERLFFRHPR